MAGVGGFRIPLRAALADWQKDLKDFREMGRRAGTETGAVILKEMQGEFRRRQGALRELLASGIIDKKQFADLSRQAAREFNTGILTALKELRKAGKDNTEEFTRLQRTLKNVSSEGTRAFSQTAKGATTLGAGLRTARNAAVALIAALGVRRAIAFLRSTITDAETLTKSYLRLSSAAKLFGVDQSLLTDLAARARTEFALNAAAANELAVNVAKLSVLSGQAARSQELLGAALDLGAAQGLDAAAVGVALEQTLRGLDEGTDKLLQKNPSQIYADYAASIGTTAGRLTDLQQKQALFNAIITAGGKVQGAYSDVLESNVGKLNVWRQRLQTAREVIGSRLLPIVVDLTTKLAGPLSAAVSGLSFLFDQLTSPLDRVLLRMERLGVASELALPAILQSRIDAASQSVADLEAQFRKLDRPLGAFAPGAGVATGVLSGSGRGDPRDVLQLTRDVQAATEEYNRIRAEGDLKATADALDTLDIAKQKLVIAQEISKQEATGRQSEAALTGALARAELAGELAEIEARIQTLLAEMAQGVVSLAGLKQLEALKAEAEALGIQLGRVKAAADGPPVVPVDEAAVKAASDAAKQLATALAQVRAEAEAAASIGLVEGVEFPPSVVASLREVVALEQRLVQLRELRAKAGAQADPDADADIAREQARLDALKQSVGETLTDLKTRLSEIPEAMVQTVASVAPQFVRAFEPTFRTMEAGVVRVREAQEELDRALIAGDSAREQRARQALDRQRDALRETAAVLLRGLEQAGLPAERLTELVEKLNEGLAAVNANVETTGEGFGKLAGEIEVSLRGLLSVFETIDALPEAAKRALVGIIALVSGIQQLGAATERGGEGGTVSSITNVAGALGGLSAIAAAVGGIIGGLASQADAAREAARRMEQARVAFSRALDEFVRSAELSIRGTEFERSIAGIGTDTAGRVGEFGEKFGLPPGGAGVASQLAGSTDVEQIRRSLQHLLSTLTDPRAIAEFTKIIEGFELQVEAAAAALANQRAEFVRDLEVQRLRDAGLGDAADALEEAARWEEVRRRAIELGVDEGLVDAAKQEHELRRARDAEAEAAAEAAAEADRLAESLRSAAEAAAELARRSQDVLTGLIEDAAAVGLADPQEAFARRQASDRENFIAQLERLGLSPEEFAYYLGLFDTTQRKARDDFLAAREGGADDDLLGTGEPSARESGQSELVKSIVGIRSTEALTIADLTRSLLTEARLQTGYLASLANLRGYTPPAPGSFMPPSVSSQSVSNSSADVSVGPINVTVNSTGVGSRGETSTTISDEILRNLDQGIERRRLRVRNASGRPSLR
jgi:hypothetical protein